MQQISKPTLEYFFSKSRIEKYQQLALAIKIYPVFVVEFLAIQNQLNHS